MEHYQLLGALGYGTFGEVRSALHKPTGEMVAVKRLRYLSGLPMEPEFECYCVSKLKHPNIVEFRDRFWDSNSDLCFVFELMHDGSLLDVMEKRTTMFTEDEIRKICHQILRGLDYMHNNGYFHLDLKPENVLVKAGDVKIGDLGSARKINSSEPLEAYVTTRYYRAPEVMLESPCYGPKVDMWAVGAVMAELFKLSPLFPGRNQADQMYRICSVIGTPTFSAWPMGFILAERANFQFPMLQGGGLSMLIPSASESAVKLISWLLSWDPSRRPTPAEALQHEFFVGSYRIPRAISCKPAQQIARTDLNVLPRFQPNF